jgi:nucleotide-binding universal stress UspA family protein
MTPKTILACLTTEECASDLARVGIALAERWGAHLIGFHTIEALMVYPGIAMHMPPSAYSAFDEAQGEMADRIAAIFRRATAAQNFASEWRLVRAESVMAADRMVESARVSDLVLMARIDRSSERPDQHRAQEAVIRRSGRPVLMVPPEIDPPSGEGVVVGWTETPECARALWDVLPLLQPGARIRLVTVDGAGRLGERGEAITEAAAALDRHGFEVEIERLPSGGQSVAEILQDEAFEMGADLLAVGAFGHSRAYDFVLGAVSGDLLRAGRMPVLFSR